MVAGLTLPELQGQLEDRSMTKDDVRVALEAVKEAQIRWIDAVDHIQQLILVMNRRQERFETDLEQLRLRVLGVK